MTLCRACKHSSCLTLVPICLPHSLSLPHLTVLASLLHYLPPIFVSSCQVAEGSFLKKALFNWGYSRKLHFLDKGLPYDKVGW